MRGAPPRARGRHRWIVLAVVLATGAVVVGGALVLLWGGRGAREVPVGRAVDRFRRDPSSTGTAVMQPGAGVYTYAGRGTERLAVLGASHRWGSRIPGTVSPTGNGCWTFRVDYNDHHSQVLDFCARAPGLVVTGGRVSQRFSFRGFTIADTNVFTCAPPGVAVDVHATVGTSWEYSCVSRAVDRGLTSTFTDRYSYLGRRHLRVGDSEIHAYAYRVERTLHGDQAGEEHNELWFAVDTGQPVRVHRDAHLETPTPLGTVRYVERGTFTLASTTPRR